MPRRSDLHGGLSPLGSRRGKRNGLIALAVFAPELPNTIGLLPGFRGLPFHHLDVLREPRSKRNSKKPSCIATETEQGSMRMVCWYDYGRPICLR